jgi:hypothetical protein
MHNRNMEEVRRRRARVTAFLEGGIKYIEVEFLDDNGEMVVANFERIGWDRAPAALRKQFWEAQANGPVQVLHPRAPGSQSPQSRKKLPGIERKP